MKSPQNTDRALAWHVQGTGFNPWHWRGKKMKRIAGKAHTIKYWKCMWRKITKNKNAHKKEGRKEEGGRNMKETSSIFIGQLVSGKPELKHRMTGPKFVFTYYNVCIIFYKLILFFKKSTFPIYSTLNIFVGGGRDLNAGFHSYKADAVHLEPHIQSILLWLFWRWESLKLFSLAGLKPQSSLS
jgi:hypothetical protein